MLPQAISPETIAVGNTRARNLDDVVDFALSRLGRRVVLGLPLGLGKPNRLVNAFYRRAKADPGLRLDIVTALSLDLPEPGHWLEARFAGPFVERHFGRDYPRLEYVSDLKSGRIPGNVTVSEFYFQSGAALGKPALQRNYISSNYTHVARDLVDRGVNLTLQLIAGPVGGRYSLSSNPDVSLDLKRRVQDTPGHACMMIGQIHPDLPFMHGDAVVDAEFFDLIVEEDPRQPLFGLPRTPVSVQDYWVGLHASRLIVDGGTLQIGIGSLSDALVHALTLRHENNSAWRSITGASAHAPADKLGGADPFEQGLYGASEMFMDGFMHLYRAGILKREVFDDEDLQRRANSGEDLAEAGTGALMDGGFFLGTKAFYAFLNGLGESEQPRFRMHGVGRINQLYGGAEQLEILQRRGARFVNTCMMVTATGAAVSDGLADHQVVSGVGGQYNFVAMAHAMNDGRSILLLRATRESNDRTSSNIVWEYPHTTIPRHLRDLVVTEYGTADLRGKTDEECIRALIGIMDARFQDELAEQAKAAGKLDPDWKVPDQSRRNTPALLADRLAPMRDDGLFPEYPFGCDFTDIEQRLIPALQRLKRVSRSKVALARALIAGRPAEFPEELARIGLDAPSSLHDRVYARLVAAALAQVSANNRPRGR